MNVAAQLWTVREQLKDPAQTGRVLDRLREIGYPAVEVAALPPEVAEVFDAYLAAADLTACAAHIPLEDLRADAVAVGQRCKRWGCEYAVVPSLPGERRSATDYERFGAEAVVHAAALAPFGVRLAYHDHAFELERWHGRTGLEILFAAAPVGALDAELDTYWLLFAGADPATTIRGLSGRVPLVHLKDVALRAGGNVQTAVGDGDMDWKAILDACRAAGTGWLVVEQDECEGEPLDSLATSLRNVEALLD